MTRKMTIEIPAKKTEMFTWVISGLQDARAEFESRYDEDEKNGLLNCYRELIMDDVKIRKGNLGFYDRFDNKVALLEEGQRLKIVRELSDGKYVCRVINPTERCKNHGGYDGMLVEAYVENLETIETESH